MLITNGDLELVDDGINYVIRTEKEVLDGCVFHVPVAYRPSSPRPVWANGARKLMERSASPHSLSLLPIYASF